MDADAGMKKGEKRGKKGRIFTLKYQFYRVLRGEKGDFFAFGAGNH
jgi:hypothetical protein